jgi:hypothetical protein
MRFAKTGGSILYLPAFFSFCSRWTAHRIGAHVV